MSKKSEPSQYTNIEQFLRSNYPEIAELFDYCELFNATLTQREDGITFLIPDKKYITKLRQMAYSTNSDDISKSCNALLSLVMRRALLKPAEWLADDIADKRFPPQKITAQISLENPKAVNLQSGGKTYATIELDDKAKFAFRKIAVWHIVDGQMRDEMDAPAQMKRRKFPGRTRQEPRDVSGGDAAEVRESVRKHILLCAMKDFEHMDSAAADATAFAYYASPFVTYTISFAKFMHANYKDVFVQRILPLLHCRATDFFIVFEPYCNSGFIPEENIAEWWATFQYNTHLLEDLIKYRGWLDKCLAEAPQTCDAAIYTRSADLINVIDGVRVQLSSALQNKQKIAAEIFQVYDNLASTNKIDDIANIFPQPLAEHYKEHPRAKLIQDELSFVVEMLLISAYQRAHGFTASQISTVLSMVFKVTTAKSIAEVDNNLILVNRKKIELPLGDVVANEIRAFVNSTLFIWVPLTTEQIKNYPIENKPERPRHTTEVLFNADLAMLLYQERISASNPNKIEEMRKKMILSILDHIGHEHDAEILAKIKTIIGQQ